MIQHGFQGNISANPEFVTGPMGAYYLSHNRLQGSQSPCVDTGTNTVEELGLDMLTTATDERWDVETVDMGYHYPSAWEPPKGMIIMIK